MPITLSEKANEKSTYVVNISFFDEDDNPVIPNSGLKWTLHDRDGNVINSRQDVAISPPDTSVDIVLTNLDLEIASGYYLLMTVEGTYNSSAGNDLSLKEEIRINLNNLVYISS